MTVEQLVEKLSYEDPKALVYFMDSDNGETPVVSMSTFDDQWSTGRKTTGILLRGEASHADR